MKPWFSFVKTIIALVVCLFGVLFMVILGLAYSARAATVVGHMSSNDINAAAFSCFLCAGLYAAGALVAFFQVGVHWRYRGRAVMNSPKPISLQEIATVPGNAGKSGSASPNLPKGRKYA